MTEPADSTETKKHRRGCLTKQELAAFAADVCTQEDKDSYLQHIEECKECYDKWVALMLYTQKQQSGTGGGYVSFSSRRIHLSSVIAAAAMIAGLLFLVLYYY